MTSKRLHEIRNDDKKYIEVRGLSLDRRELLYEMDELHEKLEAARVLITAAIKDINDGAPISARRQLRNALQKLGEEG